MRCVALLALLVLVMSVAPGSSEDELHDVAKRWASSDVRYRLDGRCWKCCKCYVTPFLLTVVRVDILVIK